MDGPPWLTEAEGEEGGTLAGEAALTTSGDGAGGQRRVMVSRIYRAIAKDDRKGITISCVYEQASSNA